MWLNDIHIGISLLYIYVYKQVHLEVVTECFGMYCVVKLNDEKKEHKNLIIWEHKKKVKIKFMTEVENRIMVWLRKSPKSSNNPQ